MVMSIVVMVVMSRKKEAVEEQATDTTAHSRITDIKNVITSKLQSLMGGKETDNVK